MEQNVVPNVEEEQKQAQETVGESVSTANKSKTHECLENAFKSHKQVILTGAPGTGKTYSAIKYAESQTSEEKIKFVQFHPSYDYSDFVEGLRPVTIGENKKPSFVRVDGAFKAFCRFIVEQDYEKAPGKKIADADFAAFKKKYQEAQKKGFKEKYFFIIDEINRADLSKVLGELMFGLEESYRGINHPIKTQYMSLPTYRKNKESGKWEKLAMDVFKEGFFIPENLYIIGTMNDIDRSVEAFDFALRRRFQWVEIKADEVMESSLVGMFSDVPKNQIRDISSRIVEMNRVIADDNHHLGLSESYKIGHAYFKDLKKFDENELKDVFDSSIEPLLKEYTRGRDPDSVEKLIKDCRKALMKKED